MLGVTFNKSVSLSVNMLLDMSKALYLFLLHVRGKPAYGLVLVVPIKVVNLGKQLEKGLANRVRKNNQTEES